MARQWPSLIGCCRSAGTTEMEPTDKIVSQDSSETGSGDTSGPVQDLETGPDLLFCEWAILGLNQ